MLITLSPSKGQEFESGPVSKKYSTPGHLDFSEQLVRKLKRFKSPAVQKLMDVSANIADLNVQRFGSFQTPFTLDNAKQAALAFRGDVYGGLNIDAFSGTDLDYAQDHLRILSGLYGCLRPLDLIQPYRLEMKTRLRTPKGDNLYKFWGEHITDSLNETLAQQDESTLVNLASNEYFKAVKPKLLKGRLLNIRFKEVKNGESRIIGTFAKHARGLMANFILLNRVETIAGLKGFDGAGYRYSADKSDDQQWTFERPQPPPVAR